MTGVVVELRKMPPWGWVILTAVAGVAFLAYHRYAQDSEDVDWSGGSEQPPMRAPYPNTPGTASPGRPMECGDGFRSRAYPGSLFSAEFSIIGDC